MFNKPLILGLIAPLLLLACQTPTQVSETDKNLESRVFSKIEYGKKVELKRAVIVDVRPPFEHQMSRPPRSFHALAEDWDLKGFTGEALLEKVGELQRLLSLKGIDPYTQVVILGKGLKGKGEEFLVASSLLALGVERISFMTEEQAKRAMVAKGLPQIENVSRWSRVLNFSFDCGSKRKLSVAQKMKLSDLVVSKKFIEKGGGPEVFFTKDLKVKKRQWPKNLRVRVTSPHSSWAYGLALYLKDQGRQVCVL